MTTQKYSLKQHLLSESHNLSEHPFLLELSKGASRIPKNKSWSAIVYYDHPSDGCSTRVHLAIDDETHHSPPAVWIDLLEVVNTKTRRPDPQCFRKGYARQALQALIDAADLTGTHLTLIAAHEPYLSRQNPHVDFPDKDELASLYSEYGFVEEYSNYAQVKMNRAPKSST